MDIALIINIFLHIDKYLGTVISTYGTLVYSILFLIIFIETGLVIMPFLPGDSLLFAAGTFSAIGSLNLYTLILLLFFAAVLGDSFNYLIGNKIGRKLFSRENSRFLNRKNLEKTEIFYEKYGGKTIIIARFIPIIRTFAPFIAGMGKMKYSKFLLFNIVGGAIWVLIFVLGGYYFGNIPIIKENFSIAIIVIILISLSPMIIEFIKHIRKN